MDGLAHVSESVAVSMQAASRMLTLGGYQDVRFPAASADRPLLSDGGNDCRARASATVFAEHKEHPEHCKTRYVICSVY